MIKLCNPIISFYCYYSHPFRRTNLSLTAKKLSGVAPCSPAMRSAGDEATLERAQGKKTKQKGAGEPGSRQRAELFPLRDGSCPGEANASSRGRGGRPRAPLPRCLARPPACLVVSPCLSEARTVPYRRSASLRCRLLQIWAFLAGAWRGAQQSPLPARLAHNQSERRLARRPLVLTSAAARSGAQRRPKRIPELAGCFCTSVSAASRSLAR